VTIPQEEEKSKRGLLIGQGDPFMSPGYELIRQQPISRKELIERVRWFIQLRWVAVGMALLGNWVAFLLRLSLPTLPFTILLACIVFYNSVFLLVWKYLKSSRPDELTPYLIFAHVQIFFDLLALYFVICLTGGIYSPLLFFVIFHIILAGILLSPLSCFVYAVAVIVALGSLIVEGNIMLFSFQPNFFQAPLSPNSNEPFDILTRFLTFAAAILISAFLVTSIKSSLNNKEKELLTVSRELEASNAKLTALYEMVREMGRCTDLQELMDSATRNATKIMGVKGCSIKLLDDQRKTLKFASTFGLSEDYLAKGSVDIDKSPINRKVIEGAVYSIGKIAEKDYFAYPEDIEKEGIASIVCLPLKVEKMVIGVFCIYSNVSYYFSDEDVKVFSLMADLTALAIENLRTGITKSWFLQKAAHQLRSPFNAIYSMLKLLSKGYLGAINEKQQETIQRCEKRIEILGYLINDLLKLGLQRAEAGKSIYRPVDLIAIMNRMTNLYQVQAIHKGVQITFHMPGRLPFVAGNDKIIDDLFTNLIFNAIKYTPQGGSIDVSLAKENHGWIRFEVSDTGIGIPEEDQPRLFSEFFRAENAKALAEKGTGLGLVIVKEIVEQMKGSITVKSKTGAGTTFTCLLPTV
jgi:K+-sensing histidine kinase KdpD